MAFHAFRVRPGARAPIDRLAVVTHLIAGELCAGIDAMPFGELNERRRLETKVHAGEPLVGAEDPRPLELMTGLDRPACVARRAPPIVREKLRERAAVEKTEPEEMHDLA